MPNLERWQREVYFGAKLYWYRNDLNGARVHHIAAHSGGVSLYYNDEEQISAPTLAGLVAQGVNLESWTLYQPMPFAHSVPGVGVVMQQSLFS